MQLPEHDEDAGRSERKIGLRWMTIRAVFIDRPREVGRDFAVAAFPEKASPAPDGLAGREGHREQIARGPYDPETAFGENDCDVSANDAAEQCLPRGPGDDELRDVRTGKPADQARAHKRPDAGGRDAAPARHVSKRCQRCEIPETVAQSREQHHRYFLLSASYSKGRCISRACRRTARLIEAPRTRQ